MRWFIIFSVTNEDAADDMTCLANFDHSSANEFPGRRDLFLCSSRHRRDRKAQYTSASYKKDNCRVLCQNSSSKLIRIAVWLSGAAFRQAPGLSPRPKTQNDANFPRLRLNYCHCHCPPKSSDWGLSLWLKTKTDNLTLMKLMLMLLK